MEAFGCWLSRSPSKWLYRRWHLSGMRSSQCVTGSRYQVVWMAFAVMATQTHHCGIRWPWIDLFSFQDGRALMSLPYAMRCLAFFCKFRRYGHSKQTKDYTTFVFIFLAFSLAALQAEAQPNFHDFHHELRLHWKKIESPNIKKEKFMREPSPKLRLSKEKFNVNYGAMGWLDDLHGTSWDWKKDFWGRRALHDGPKAAKAA